MRNDLEYEMFVRQPVHLVMEQVERDAQAFGISEEELTRAVHSWVSNRLTEESTAWLISDLENDQS